VIGTAQNASGCDAGKGSEMRLPKASAPPRWEATALRPKLHGTGQPTTTAGQSSGSGLGPAYLQPRAISSPCNVIWIDPSWLPSREHHDPSESHSRGRASVVISVPHFCEGTANYQAEDAFPGPSPSRNPHFPRLHIFCILTTDPLPRQIEVQGHLFRRGDQSRISEIRAD
jgi:hypothetical protein